MCALKVKPSTTFCPSKNLQQNLEVPARAKQDNCENDWYSREGVQCIFEMSLSFHLQQIWRFLCSAEIYKEFVVEPKCSAEFRNFMWERVWGGVFLFFVGFLFYIFKDSPLFSLSTAGGESQYQSIDMWMSHLQIPLFYLNKTKEVVWQDNSSIWFLAVDFLPSQFTPFKTLKPVMD